MKKARISNVTRNVNYATNVPGPGAYTSRNKELSQKYSFGMRSSGEMIKVKHIVPAHLDKERNGSPGPGSYTSPSSFRSPNKHVLSL